MSENESGNLKSPDDNTTSIPTPGSSSLEAPGLDPARRLLTLPLSAAPTPTRISPERLSEFPAHGFILLRPHERGGLGLVGVAKDVSLDREVAFKQIRPELADDPGSRNRFVHEAKITGQLEHPNIVPVHALGRDADGRPYYAMKFVKGRTLRQAIDEYHKAPTPEAFRDLLRRFVSVCQAIAYAHSKGVIHRDLKPANIMLGDFGETLILDWGLAKRLAWGQEGAAPSASENDTLDSLFADDETAAGQVVGTPGYLAPEQAGTADRQGPPADVYSLGAVLYKLLCNQTPYKGGTSADALLRGKLERPVPPSMHLSTVPRALEAVCLRAMATRPEERYDAAGLADEIERWLADEPVRAWREPLVIRTMRWARHHRPVVVGLAVLLISLIVGLVINNVLVRRERTHTEEARVRATAQEKVARNNEREARLQVARTNVFQGEALALAGQWEAAKARYSQGGEQLTALGESRYPADVGLWNTFRAAPPPLLRCRVEGRITALAFAPGADAILIATQLGTLQLRDARTGRVVAPSFLIPEQAGAPRPAINCVAFSQDGHSIVSGSEDHTLTLWNAKDGKSVRTFRGHAARVAAVAFSGGQILSGSTDKTLKLWNPDSADAVYIFKGHASGITALACSADGRIAFSGGSEPDDNLRAWDVPARKLLHVFSGHTDNIASVGISRDGLVAVSGSADRTARCWEVASGQLIQTLGGQEQTVSAVALSPDTHRLICGTLGGDLEFWTVEQGRQVATLAGHHSSITSTAFSTDGRVAASGDADGNLLLWDAFPSQQASGARNLGGPDSFVTCAAISADGLMALSGGSDHVVRVWDVATGLSLAQFTDQRNAITRVTFSPDGRLAASAANHIASAANDGTVWLWDLSHKAPGRSITMTARINALAFAPDSGSLATGSADGAVRLWDIHSDKPIDLNVVSQSTKSVTCLSFSSDGKSVLAGSADGTLKLWPTLALSAGQRRAAEQPFGGQGSAVTCLAISPDGRTALSGARGSNGDRGSLVLWNLANGQPLRRLAPQRQPVSSVGFTTDGRFGLICSLDESVTLWDVNSESEPFRSIVGHGEFFETVCIWPNGRGLISGGYDKALRVWDFDGPQICKRLQPRAEAALKLLLANSNNSHEDPTALVALGEWYAFRGHPDWAADFFTRAAAGGANVPALTWARCSWQIGDTASAAQQMQIARSRGEAQASYLDLCLHAIEFSEQAKTTATPAPAAPRPIPTP